MQGEEMSLEAVTNTYLEIKKIEVSSLDWSTKYDMIFKLSKSMRLAGVDPDYYDPDSSYEEDVRAYTNALDEIFKDAI